MDENIKLEEKASVPKAPVLVRIDDIKVTKRIRTDFGDINGLSVSIEKYGLLHPIIVDENLNLIAGERRLRAHEKLGRTEIMVKYREDLDEIQKKEIELEENVQRKDLEWPEKILAKLHLHDLRIQIHGKKTGHTVGHGWGQDDTAMALDESVGTVSMDLQLAKAIQSFPELRNEKSKTNAFKKYKRMEMTLLRQELNKRRRGKIVIPNIIHGLAEVETKKIASESCDFCLTDPPFGQGVDKMVDSAKNIKGVDYDDDPYKVMEMLRTVSTELYRIMKPNTHMIMAFTMAHYMNLYKILTEIGFNVDRTPLIWNKETPSGPSTGVTFPYTYEPAFWCMKGRRGLNSTACNMFTYKRVPAALKKHPMERPQGLLVAMINAISFPGEKGIDPFGGGGSFMSACLSTSREAIIIEKDETNYMAIIERYETAKARRSPKEEEVGEDV